jgi:hypothetical protein
MGTPCFPLLSLLYVLIDHKKYSVFTEKYAMKRLLKESRFLEDLIEIFRLLED